MPSQNTISKRDQVEDLAKQLSKLSAAYKAKQPSSCGDFVNIKSKAIAICHQVQADGNPTADDEAAVDKALFLAETAGAYAELTSGRKVQPDDVSMYNPREFGDNRRNMTTSAGPNGLAVSDFVAADPSTLDNGGFESLGGFLKAIRDQRSGSRFDQRLEMMAVGQTGSDGPGGGFLIPDYFGRELIMSASQREPWLALRRQFIVPQGADSVTFPVLSDRDRSGQDVGGVELTRTIESGQISLSTAVFKSRKSSLYKAATRVRVSNELLSDSGIGIDSALRAIFAEAVALRQALDFVSGVGVGEPLGVMNAPATYTLAKESGQTADTIVTANILKMWERLSAGARGNAIWIAHPSTFEQLASLSLVVGTGGSPAFLMDLASASPRSLMGAPIYFTEAAPTLGNKGDLMLFNPQSYLYAMKSIRIDTSRDFRFDYDETEFRIVMRDDGGPLHDSTHTDAQSFESSEFVALAERA